MGQRKQVKCITAAVIIRYPSKLHRSTRSGPTAGYYAIGPCTTSLITGQYEMIVTSLNLLNILVSGGSSIHEPRPSRSRAGTPVCQRANPAVAVVRYSWCRAGGFIRAAVGYVCAVGQSCAVCVLTMWLQVGLSHRHEQQVNRIFPKKKMTKYREGGNSHLRDILGCADHVWREYPNSPGSSKTPDAHSSALNDQYRDISELRHAKVVVKVDSIHGRNHPIMIFAAVITPSLVLFVLLRS